MLSSFRGVILVKDPDRVVIEAGGVGYEVFVTPASSAQLPALGQTAFLLVVESFGIYGGGATLYGFASPGEKTMFMAFRDNVPSTGAKKALEYLDKASKSLPDFRRAILEHDGRILSGVFGFTKKTADKLIAALKDKLEGAHLLGAERLVKIAGAEIPTGALSQALNALAALGYKPGEARAALAAVAEDGGSEKLPVEQILRLALKRL